MTKRRNKNMPTHIIDLDPEAMNALNKKIEEIINMPEELLRLYTEKPHITEDEQTILEKAAMAYQSEKFTSAVKYYRKFIAKKNNARTKEYKLTQLDIIVQYLLSKSLMASKQFMDLIQARDLLLEIEETAHKYPMIYYALAEFYIKLFCFEDAERMINKGLGILNDSNNTLINCYIPISNKIISESTNQGLSIKLLKLKKRCMDWHRPDAVCFMTSCRLNSPHHLSGRNIYYNSPAFSGMVVVTCNNIDACNIQFHPACWEEQKKILSSGQKMLDKDFLNWKCFTSNCGYNFATSRIRKIEYRDNDKVTNVIELTKEKQDDSLNISSKGATRKQKIYSMNKKTSKDKAKPPATKNINLDKVKIWENILEDNHSCSNWCLEAVSCGNTDSTTNNNDEQSILFTQNDCEQFTDIELFINSYFHEFISHNGPIKVDYIQKKWEEVLNWIGCDNFLYNTNCKNIIGFLRQSSLFSVIDDHVYTHKSIPGNYLSVNDEISTTQLKNETNENIFTFNSKFENAAFRIDNSVPPISKIVAVNTQNKELILKENHFLDIHDTNKTLVSNGELSYQTKKVEYEGETVMNGNIDNNNSLPASPLSIPKKYNIINAVVKQLMRVYEELEAKNIELINMKIEMLKTNLNYQYKIIEASINNRLENCQGEYKVVNAMQKALMKYVGVSLPLEEREWLEPIKILNEMKKFLKQAYDKKYMLINSKKYCKDIDDVYLVMPNFPELPNRDIPELLRVAFDMCYNCFYNSSKTILPVIIPFYYPPQLPSNPPMSVPPYRNNFPLSTHSPPQPHPAPYPPFTSIFQSSTNNNLQRHTNKMPIQKQATIINKVDDIFKNSNNLSKIEMQDLKCDELKLYNEKVERLSTLNVEQTPDLITKPKRKKPSLDLLLDILRSRNRGVLEYDLLWNVNQVRKKHDNSLTGLSLSTIIKEVEQQLVNREKLQLADYSVKIEKEDQQNSNDQLSRKTSISSISSHASTTSSKKSITKKNPWNIITDLSSWQDTDSGENICAICIESLDSYKPNTVYKLQCKHIFHMKCIKKWLSKDRSCPNCRTAAVMDSQFPPL